MEIRFYSAFVIFLVIFDSTITSVIVAAPAKESCKRYLLPGIPEHKIPADCRKYAYVDQTTVANQVQDIDGDGLPTPEVTTYRRSIAPGIAEQRRRGEEVEIEREREREWEDRIIVIKEVEKTQPISSTAASSSPGMYPRHLPKDTSCSGPECADPGPASSKNMHEMMRTVAVLVMTLVATVTVVVLAIAVFCVVKNRIEDRTSEAHVEEGELVKHRASISNSGPMDNREYMTATTPVSGHTLSDPASKNGIINGLYLMNQEKKQSPTNGAVHKPGQGAYEYTEIDGYGTGSSTNVELNKQMLVLNSSVGSNATPNIPISSGSHYYFKLALEDAVNCEKKSKDITSKTNELPDNKTSPHSSSSNVELLQPYGRVYVPVVNAHNLGSNEVMSSPEEYDRLDHTGNVFKMLPNNRSQDYDKLAV